MTESQNEIEAMLAKDRLSPLPELPEPGFTAAAVARRLAERDAAGKRRGRSLSTPGHPVRPLPSEPGLWLGAVSTGLAAVAVALALGVSPWWFLVQPLLLIPLIPILHKGVH